MRVLLAQDIGPEGKDYLRERGYEVVVASHYDVDTMKKEIVGADGVIVRSAPFTAEIMKCADRLKVISRYGVGVEAIDLEAATAYGIQVTNGPTSNSNAVAEHAVAMMAALTKKLYESDQAMRSGYFNFRNEHLAGDLEKKKVGILGLGRIGRLVAKKCHFGFDMDILGYDPYVTELPDYIQPASVEDILRASDYISLHLPATPETKDIIGKDQLRMMKPSAILINVARADVVNEEALAWALETGEIAYAGVDVFSKEPPPESHPFFKLKNILMTPHYAALSVNSAVNMGLHAAQGIDDVLSGRKPAWPVNRLG